MALIDLTLDGVSLAAAVPDAVVQDVNRPLAGEVRTEFVTVPGRAGSWDFDEEPGEISLTFSIAILVDTVAARRAAIGTLAAWARTPSGRADLVISDEPSRVWEVRLAAGPPMVDDETMGQTSVVFSARPYALASTPTVENIAASGPPDSGSFVASDVVEADPVIELTPTDGTLESFVLDLNGDSVAWSGAAIAQDDTITISSLADVVTVGANFDVNLTGAFDPADVDMVDVAVSGFPTIVPGSNPWNLQWSGSATAVTIVITWRERII